LIDSITSRKRIANNGRGTTTATKKGRRELGNGSRFGEMYSRGPARPLSKTVYRHRGCRNDDIATAFCRLANDP